MEKRLIFQTEGYGKSDVTYELRMCLPYIPDPVRRKTAAELVRKLDAMPEKDCLALIQDIRKNYRIPAGPKTMGELLAEARQKSGAEKLKGHDIMALERFDPEVKHMIGSEALEQWLSSIKIITYSLEYSLPWWNLSFISRSVVSCRIFLADRI